MSNKEESRFDTLYHGIRERICLLQYPPGTVLKEESLATEFGVSRTPVRRALQKLEFERLVDINQRSGAIVTTVDLKLLKEVYALRLKLVELTGDLARNRVPPGMIDNLHTLLEQCQTYQTHYDPEGLARLYNQFHHEMLRVIGNQALREFSDQLFHQTARVWLQILPDLDWDTEVTKMCAEIADIIVALEAIDMQRVADIRREHMAQLLGRINDYLSSADAG